MIPAFLVSRNGDVYLNHLKKYVKGSILGPRSDLVPVAVPALAGGVAGTSPILPMEGPQESVIEVYSLLGYESPTDNADVARRLSMRIYDGTWRRYLSNRDVLVTQCLGVGQRPFFLREPMMMEGMQVHQVQFFNNSAAGAASFYGPFYECRKAVDANINYAYVTRFLKENRPRKALLYPYWLTSDQAVTLPASGTREVFFTNTQDQTLILFYQMALAITAGGTGDTQEMVSFQFYDPKTQRPYQNSPVTLNCCAGTGQFPFLLPVPIMMEPASKMRVTMTNLITDGNTEVFFTFQGIGYYQGSAPAEYANHAQVLARQPYGSIKGNPGMWEKGMTSLPPAY
jgi:hypothetical protein